MKITFLGTSHGVPAADRYCSCTMIEAGGNSYFIDAGAPLIDILLRRGTDLKTVKAIFTTHIHGDHTLGLIPLADLFSWYFKDTSVDIFMTEEKGVRAFTDLIKAVDALDEGRVRFRVMGEGPVYDDGVVRVTAFPTQHMAPAGRPAYSYLVQAEGKEALFSGDLSGELRGHDFPKYALEHEPDILVCEMAHFSVDDATPYLEKCRAKKVLFNHVFPLDKLDKIDALDGRWGYPIRTAADGETIVL